MGLGKVCLALAILSALRTTNANETTGGPTTCNPEVHSTFNSLIALLRHEVNATLVDVIESGSFNINETTTALLQSVNDFLSAQTESVSTEVKDLFTNNVATDNILGGLVNATLITCADNRECNTSVCVCTVGYFEHQEQCFEGDEAASTIATVTSASTENGGSRRKKRSLNQDDIENIQTEIEKQLALLITNYEGSVTITPNGTQYQISAPGVNTDFLVIATKKAFAVIGGYTVQYNDLVTLVFQRNLSCDIPTSVCEQLVLRTEAKFTEIAATYEDITCSDEPVYTITISEALPKDNLDVIVDEILSAANCASTGDVSCDNITCNDNKMCSEHEGIFLCTCPPNSEGSPCNCSTGYKDFVANIGCTAITCEVLASPDNAGLSCSAGEAFGSVCTFSCDEGFSLNGESSTTCQGLGEWSNTESICQIITCPELDDSFPDCEITYGSACNKTCDDGFIIDGNPEIVCTSDADDNGVWTELEATCEAITCVAIVSLENGDVSCSDGEAFESVCTFSCDEGFSLNGESSTTCGGLGEWSNMEPICEIIECPERDESFSGCEVSYGSVCTKTCNDGFKIVGNPDIVCTSDADDNGVWTQLEATCEAITCDELGPLVNGSIECSDAINFGSVCTYSCEQGFSLIGESSTICGGLGEWSNTAPICETIKCSELDVNYIGCTNEFNFGSKCDFSCGLGLALIGNPEVECTGELNSDGDGTWSTLEATCEQIKCDPIQAPAEGTSTCSNEQVLHGASCTIECNEGFELTEGVGSVTCGDGSNENGAWSNTEEHKCEDYCASQPCNNNQICTSHATDFTCTCNEGFAEPLNHNSKNFECIKTQSVATVTAAIAVTSRRKRQLSGINIDDTLRFYETLPMFKTAIEAVALAAGQTTVVTITQDGNTLTFDATDLSESMLLSFIYKAIENDPSLLDGHTLTITSPIVSDVTLKIESVACLCDDVEQLIKSDFDNKFTPYEAVTCVKSDNLIEITVVGAVDFDANQLSDAVVSITCGTLDDFNECDPSNANECYDPTLCVNTYGSYTCGDCNSDLFDKFAGTSLAGRACVVPVTLDCQSNYIDISADTDYLKSFGFELSEFHLYDSTCILADVGGNRYGYRLDDFSLCNTVIEQVGDKVQYTNAITTFELHETTHGDDFKYTLKCLYNAAVSITLEGEDGSFTVEKEQFIKGPTEPLTHDSNYNTKLSLLDPATGGLLTDNKITIDGKIRMQAEVETTAEVSLEFIDCWAQPSNGDSVDVAKEYIIKDRCPTDVTDLDKIIDNGQSKTPFFDFSPFSYGHFDKTYIFCDVNICADKCPEQAPCTQPGRRKRSSRARDTDLSTVWLGPLVLEVTIEVNGENVTVAFETGNKEDKLIENEINVLAIAIGTTFGAIIIIFLAGILFYLRKRAAK